MVKRKILEKQKISSQKNVIKLDTRHCKEFQPFEYILNKENILGAVKECLQENDFEGIIEVIQIYLRTVKRAKKYKKELAASKQQPSFETAFETGIAPKFAHSCSGSSKKYCK